MYSNIKKYKRKGSDTRGVSEPLPLLFCRGFRQGCPLPSGLQRNDPREPSFGTELAH